MPTSTELKVKLDARRAEYAALQAEIAALQEDAVEAWGTKAGDSAAQRVVVAKVKLDTLETILTREDLDYQAAVRTERQTEHNSLLDQAATLRQQRESLIAAQVDAENGLRAAESELGHALESWRGYSHGAENGDPTQEPASELTAKYDRAKAALDRLIKATSQRDSANGALVDVRQKRLEIGEPLIVIERRLYILADLLGIDYDERQRRFKPDDPETATP